MAKTGGKKYLLYTLLLLSVLFIISLSYFLSSKKNTNPYSFVPENAVLIWENQNTYSTFEKLKNTNMWESFSQIPFYDVAARRLKVLDSLEKENNALKFFLRDKNFRISLHITSSNDFDFIFYMPFESREDKEVFKMAMDRFRNSAIHSVSERAFQNTPITTIKNLETEDQFAFIMHRNHIIGSMTPFLVEDVIRHVKTESNTSFYDKNRKSFEAARIKNDDGDLYMNNERFGEFLKCFVLNDYSEDLEMIREFSESAFFDISLNTDKIYLNGATRPSEKTNKFLDIFKGQKSGKLKLAPYLPMNTAIYYGFSFDNGITYQQNLKQYLKNSESDKIIPEWYRLSVEDNIYIEKIFEFLGSHFAYVTLESTNPSKPSRLFYMDCNDPEATLDYLDVISAKFSKLNDGEIPFEENYRGITISEMKKKEYLQLSFSKYFGGFDKCYYFNIDDYIIFANDIPACRTLIDDIRDEKVWGKSVKLNLFFEELIQESNVNVIINTPRIWSVFKSTTNKNWKSYFESNSGFFKSFELMALQYSYLDKKFYTGAVIQHKKTSAKRKLDKQELSNPMSVKLDNEINTKAKIVRNHNDNSFEILVQDKKNNLFLISANGKILWKKSLKGSLVENGIYQIDFYKNGKLQYAMSDDKYFYIIDRNGQNVENYPIKIARDQNQYLRFFNVIDYDNSKNYRFISSDNKGNVYITDKFGKKLEGWDPLVLDFDLAAMPRHTRILEKDIIVLLTKEGKLHLKKRNSNNYSGSPVDLYNRVNTDYFIELKKNFKNSVINIIDEQGLLKQVNFEGRIISESQFFRPDQETRFDLVPDALGKTFCITRKSKGDLGILSSINKEMVKVNASEKALVQYYNFGGDNEIFSVIDRNKGKANIYRSDGNRLLQNDLNATRELSIIYYDTYEKFNLYTVFENEVSLITFGN